MKWSDYNPGREIQFSLPGDRPFMNSIPLEEAQRELPRVIADVLANAEPCVVVTASGEQVVVMRRDDFSAWNETAYLLSSDANAAHLRRGIAEVEAGKNQSPPPNPGKDHR